MARTSSIIMPSILGIVMGIAGCRRKSVMFFVRFLFFFVTLWNDEVCDNGNTIKQYNFQNNYGVIA